MADRLKTFLEDKEIPREIRALVKDRLDPDPPWKPEPEKEEE